MLAIYCDQTNSYEITMNVYQARKNKRNMKRRFSLSSYLKLSSALSPKIECSPN